MQRANQLSYSATLALALALGACSGDEPLILLDDEGNVIATTGIDDEEDGSSASDPCPTPEDFGEAPTSIADTVDFLNAMDKPVELPCFLKALPRPLKAHASESVFSAQPAVGRRSPRLFVFGDGLIMTVVPEGIGSHLLELGEIRSETRSLKGEIVFPVEDELEPEAPYEDLFFDEDVTNCAFCHAAEQSAEDIDFTRAFISDALRPLDSQRVALTSLVSEQRSCDPESEAEPERCDLLDALFADGEIVETDFPDTFKTFF